MATLSDPFKSKEERIFWGLCSVFPQMVEGLEDYQVIGQSYEAIRLQVAGGAYTPDFYLKLKKVDHLLLVLIEVKGSKKQKGYTNTRIKLNSAAALFPEFAFFEVMVDSRLQRLSVIERINKKPFAFISFPARQLLR